MKEDVEALEECFSPGSSLLAVDTVQVRAKGSRNISRNRAIAFMAETKYSDKIQDPQDEKKVIQK